MSTHVTSLKKQIELLQGEVEVYANAVDRLATQLADKEAQSSAVAPAKVDRSAMAAVLEREPDMSEITP